jgi:hypothetical protein
LCEILPESFKLHSKLLEIGDPETHEINISLNGLAKTLNQDPLFVYFFLTTLAGLKFPDLPRFDDFDEKIRIIIRVHY